jgi:hypothetical protein
VRRSKWRRPTALKVETATRLEKELLARSLSCTSGMDIRPCLIGDEKQWRASSPASAEVIRGMHVGGRSSWPMMTNPRAKEVHGCEE